MNGNALRGRKINGRVDKGGNVNRRSGVSKHGPGYQDADWDIKTRIGISRHGLGYQGGQQAATTRSPPPSPGKDRAWRPRKGEDLRSYTAP